MPSCAVDRRSGADEQFVGAPPLGILVPDPHRLVWWAGDLVKATEVGQAQSATGLMQPGTNGRRTRHRRPSAIDSDSTGTGRRATTTGSAHAATPLSTNNASAAFNDHTGDR
jgi:hypothetical protein